MTELIYGLDPEQSLTPLQVRDALSRCFFEAHCQDVQLSGDQSEITQNYCLDLVKKAFTDSGGDFDSPDKQSIMRALLGLSEFTKNFRNQEIVKQHVALLSRLIDKL